MYVMLYSIIREKFRSTTCTCSCTCQIQVHLQDIIYISLRLHFIDLYSDVKRTSSWSIIQECLRYNFATINFYIMRMAYLYIMNFKINSLVSFCNLAAFECLLIWNTLLCIIHIINIMPVFGDSKTHVQLSFETSHFLKLTYKKFIFKITFLILQFRNLIWDLVIWVNKMYANYS